MSGITFSGLSSGIDVEGIISQMIRLESNAVTRLQQQQIQIQAKQSVYSQFRSKLVSLATASSALNFPSAYSTVKGKSTTESVASVSVGESAQAGTFSLDVTQLASRHKVSSSAQASATDALGIASKFTLNGRLIDVTATDSLTNVAAKINSAGAGVSATVVNGGAGQVHLVLTGSESGAKNGIQFADVEGTLASTLGLTGGAAAVRQLNGNTATSASLSSDSATLGAMLGKTGTGSFTVDGQVVSVDYDTDTLVTLAGKVNALGGSFTASVTNETVGGSTRYRLQLTGPGMPGSLVDTDSFLESIGVLQRTYTTELVQAKDATYVLDGIALSSTTNTVAGVVEGVTINLASTGQTTIQIDRDTDATKQKVKDFQSAFNDIVEFIRVNSDFDDETFASGALFGDQTASQVEGLLNELLFSSVGQGTLRNLTQVGFGMDDQGKLTLDESKLDSALTNQPEELKALFMATGSTSVASLKFVTASSKTMGSGSTGYAVEITQLATKSLATGTVAPSSPWAATETLTLGGTMFGDPGITVTLGMGMTLNDIVQQLNNDARLKDKLVASIDINGMLQLESARYGAQGSFTVTSDLAAGADNSGLGTTSNVIAGLDVAGTIDGEPATGTGQFLTGSESNLRTSGLQIQYTGNTLGLIGTVSYVQGIGALVNNRLQSFTDTVNGLFGSLDKSFTDQVSDIDKRISDIREALTRRETQLRRQFAAMEEAMARMNAQGSQLASFFAGLG